jgi:hypothetical protein
MALEHLVAASIHLRDEDEACRYAKELAVIGEKLRDGSERPLGRAMLAICRHRKDKAEYRPALEDALQTLREVDAKQRLAFVLTQAASIESASGQLDSAAARATEAVELSRILQQPSEMALARSVLLRIARERGDKPAVREQVEELGKINGYAKHIGAIVQNELSAADIELESGQRELEAEE